MAAFISVWSVPFGGSDESRTVILPIISGTILNGVTVDWGDESEDDFYDNYEITNAEIETRPLHIYDNGGEKTITITCLLLDGWSFFNEILTENEFIGTPALLKSITQYGNLRLANTGGQFIFCSNLLSFPQTGTPLLLPSNCYSMFINCIKLNTNLHTLDTSNVRNMSEMFNGCTVFNGNISNWNVSGVTNMLEMFFGCDAFRQDISQWVLTGITNNQVPTFSPTYIDAVKPLFSAEYPNAWKFNVNNNNFNTIILNSIIPESKRTLYSTRQITEGNDTFIKLERNPFVTTWTVTAATALALTGTITLPISTNANTTIRVDWGDGNGELVDVNTGVRPNHTYTARTEPYTIRILGRINGWSFANLAQDNISRSCFRSITSYGCLLDIGNTGSQFQDCPNLTIFPQTGTLLLPVNCSNMFQGCSSLNTNLNTLNTTNVQNMFLMFERCNEFNGDISTWTVQNVNNMSIMFGNCFKFNGNISAWNVQSVENMTGMFTNCYIFTGASLFSLPVSVVKTMDNMFLNCFLFTGNPALVNWDVQRVEDMSSMFRKCDTFTGEHIFTLGQGNALKLMKDMFRNSILFNGNIANWDVSNVTDMFDIFLGCTGFRTDISKWVLTGITANSKAPTFSTVYIDVVKPKFSSAYPASWKFTGSGAVDKNIINTILPANRKDRYYMDDDLRLRRIIEAPASAITGSGNSSVKYAYNSRIKIFF